MKNNWKLAEKVLKNDGVVVLPTDTLYGVVGSAFSKKAVEKIYKIKKRSKNKPFIVLISSYKDLNLFEIKIDKEQAKIFSKFWPGKVTIEFLHSKNRFSHIRGGNNYSGFRMIGKRNKNLFNLIQKVGPIVAPSANKQGEIPAKNIKEAKDYFGKNVNLYISSGRRDVLPSKIVRYTDGVITVLRK